MQTDIQSSAAGSVLGGPHSSCRSLVDHSMSSLHCPREPISTGAVDRALWAVQEGMLPSQAELGGVLGCATSEAFVFKGSFEFVL